MNRDQFEKAMSGVDEKYVAEAAAYKKPSLRGKIIRIGSLAACAVLVLVGAVGMLSGKNAAKDEAACTTTEYSAEEQNSRNYYSGGGMSKGEMEIAEEPAYEQPADDWSEQSDYSNGQKGGMVSDRTSTAQDTGIGGTKIIYTARITLESKEFDTSFTAVESIVNGLGGYFQDQSVYDQGGSVRTASMTIRVPQEKYQTALEQLKAVAHVTFSNQSADNISKDYYDVQSRLDTAKIKLERLRTLLAEATDMADIIEIENAISNVEWEIDYYSGTLRDYDALIDYSTIILDLNEVQELTNTDPEPVSFGARLKNSFVNGFEAIGDGVVDFVEWFVGNIIWITLIAAAIIIAVKVIKKKRRGV